MSRKILYAIFFTLLYVTELYGIELSLHPSNKQFPVELSADKPSQLPLSHINFGKSNISTTWLANPSNRYAHGVLGDDLEATRLVVETGSGQQLHYDLPEHRVFEDIQARLVDINGDNLDEVLVVESDNDKGAALAIYAIKNNRLKPLMATPFLGQSYRWLNPLGVGDFNGDQHLDIALVATPHIGGILRLYKVENNNLTLYAERHGVSTHKIGSTELGLGTVIPSQPRDRILLPNQNHDALLLLEWSPQGWNELAKLKLPGKLKSSLYSLGKNSWLIKLYSGQFYEVKLSQ